MYLVKTPWLLKKLYPKELLWNMPKSEKTLYLTFDDGPIPIVTPWVLETLKTYQAKATFFCIGDNIIKHPEIFRMLKNEGHAIGNHTFNHLNGWQTTDEIYLDNIKKCQDLTQTNLFRPPYGRIKFSQIRKFMNWKCASNHISKDQKLKTKNPRIIMWDVLSGDFDEKISPETCLKNLIKYAENGSVIVFHDSLKARKNLEYVLPKALDYWKQQGCSFKALEY